MGSLQKAGQAKGAAIGRDMNDRCGGCWPGEERNTVPIKCFQEENNKMSLISG